MQHIYLLIFLCLAITCVKCCGNKERGVYCKNRVHVDYQVFLCPGVEPKSCPRWTFQCACKRNLFRRKDGDCVKSNECAMKPEPEEPLGGERPEFKIPDEVKTTDLTIPARKFVKSQQTFEIVMAAEEYWLESDCVCIKSTFFANTVNGSERKFSCYKYAKTYSAPSTIQDRIGKKAIITLTEYVDIDVSPSGGYTRMDLTPAVVPNEAELSRDPEFDVLGRYWVLAVDEHCLLVAFGLGTGGKVNCMLWSLEGEQPKIETDCFRHLNNWCTDMYNVWQHTDPCTQFDRKQKRQEQLEKQEELDQLD